MGKKRLRRGPCHVLPANVTVVSTLQTCWSKNRHDWANGMRHYFGRSTTLVYFIFFSCIKNFRILTASLEGIFLHLVKFIVCCTAKRTDVLWGRCRRIFVRLRHCSAVSSLSKLRGNLMAHFVQRFLPTISQRF